mgnify:CR=1 FL=1|jgi:hypothetical protein|nr:MAG TPA: hypothetical protein [Caudoviricetes sp.]
MNNIIVGFYPFSETLKQFREQASSLGKLTIGDFEIFTTGLKPPQVTQQLPTRQPRRKTGVAQSRRDARKRRNRK